MQTAAAAQNLSPASGRRPKPDDDVVALAQYEGQPILVAVDYVRLHMDFKLDRKTFIGYMLYVVFFVIFCIVTQDVPEAYTTYAAYKAARDNAGARLSDSVTLADANQWLESGTDAIKEGIMFYCPKCKVITHGNIHGEVGVAVSDTPTTAGYVPSVTTIPRNVSYDFDQTLRVVDSLRVSRGDTVFYVEYYCRPLSSAEEQVDNKHTILVQCRELYTNQLDSVKFMGWMAGLAVAWVYRLVVIIGTVVDFLQDELRNQKDGVMDGRTTICTFAWAHISLNTVLNFLGVILPVLACTEYYRQPVNFKNFLGFNLLVICAQVFKYGRFWSPFTVIVETMNNAKWELMNFLISLFIIFIIFAITAHIMFGAFASGYQTVDRAFVNVFFVLAGEPYGMEDAFKEHNQEGTVAFFFVSNVVFILIMSQFLIAVLCGAFDTVRDEMNARDRDAKLPRGYAVIKQHSMAETTRSFMLNNFAFWNHHTCGIQTQILQECLTKLRFHKIEVATGEQMRTELMERKVSPSCVQNFLEEWGCQKIAKGEGSSIADHLTNSITDTATELREEVKVLVKEIQSKVAQLSVLDEQEENGDN